MEINLRNDTELERASMYVVEDVKPEDINPSNRFKEYVRSQKNIPFLNASTLNAFTEQVREQFVTPRDK